MKLTRRVTFSSGHRYWRNDLNEEQNRELYGNWASPFNHGHNYILEVTVAGRTDEDNGMVINIKTIDDLVRRRVVSVLDQRSLNDEIEHFGRTTPTTENLGLFVRDQLGELPREVHFVGLRLYERPDLFVDIGDDDVLKLTRSYEFSASHRLHVPAMSTEQNVEMFGKCNNAAGHGHNYELEVTVEGQADTETGMLVDIAAMDGIVRAEVVDRYDHKHLNEDIEEFRGMNPTTEVLTRMAWSRLAGKLPAKLSKVLIRETARNIFEYSGEDEI